jgi:type II secretory pathway component PulF
MWTYYYKAVSKSDHRSVESTTKAWSEWLLRRKLIKDGMVVISVNRTGATKHPSTILAEVATMGSYDQILFFRNFAMMLDSGITISHVLETLITQVRGVGVAGAIERIKSEVLNGRTLSSAMAKFPRMFPEHIVKTVEVGEQSGKLADAMDRISIDIESNFQLRRKVIGAISYPLIILVFMLLTAFLMVVFVLPQLIKMFEDLGAPVPALTRMLVNLGEFVIGNPILIFAVIVLAVSGFSVLMRVQPVRRFVHEALLRMPLFGRLMLEYNLIQITRALTTLVASGITFTHAIDVSRGVIRNEAYRSALDDIYPIVLHGGSFSDAIATNKILFPEQLRQMVLVGEQSGRLGYALEKISGHYDRSVQFQTQMLTTVIEPILMLVAGILVGMLAYSMFTPLYGVTQYI